MLSLRELAQSLRPHANSVFHMGGDEVVLSCWKGSQSVTSWLASQPGHEGLTDADYHWAWQYFQDEALRQLEAETLRLQRMEAVGALASGMAHDLNNALAPVLMGTQMLRREARDENAQRILSLMESSTRRGADMVRQVLLFARGRDGETSALDVAPLLREMEKLVRDTFPPAPRSARI